MRAHVVNDTEETVHCSPGTKTDSLARLQEQDLVCEPHAELGFLFAVTRFGKRRSAFVRVSGTTFACGFEAPLEEDASAAILVSAGIAVLLVGAIAGVVLYERRRRANDGSRLPRLRTTRYARDDKAHARDETATQIAPAASLRQAAVPGLRGLQTRGFAALLDEKRAVMAALECVRQRFSGSDFVAKVVNQGSQPLHCTIDGRTRRASVHVAPGAFWIHPQSAAAVDVTVPLRLPWRVRTLYLRMENEAVSASAQADVPAPPLLGIATALVIALLLAGALAVAALLVRPRVVAFAAPSQVLAGTSATVSYSLAGAGTARYAVLANGRAVAAGTMPMGSGSVTFPTEVRPATYRVTIGVGGAFGSAQASRTFVSVAGLTPAAAAIEALSVDPGVAAAGAPLQVRYAARADAGSIALLDVAGIALQRVPYSTRGISELSAPPVEAPTQYEVRLDVVRGSSKTSASVGLLVLPRPLATPISAAPPPNIVTAAQLLRISPAYVVSGRAFTVRLLLRPAGLQLTLQNGRGIPVATQSVASNAAAVRFHAPFVRYDEPFTIVAAFARGGADQVVLDPLVVHARYGMRTP